METTSLKSQTQKRLAELQDESQHIIDSYLKLVVTDANSPVIKSLQQRLKDLRNEQWQLFK